jgi:hypothetical protein
MATALQCPDCGRHQPIDQLSGTTFRCRRCGRLLAAPRRPSPVPDEDDRTAAAPRVEAAPKRLSRPPGRTPATAKPALSPASIRVLIWVAALVVGLVAAAFPLRAIGWLSVDDVLDAFAGDGLGRWGILLVLLPLWAAVSATLAHLAIEALERRTR